MSYGRNFSSSQQLSRDSDQDSSNSTTGAQSEQHSSRSSFGGGWGRPNGDSHLQASGGGRWGRPNGDSHLQASGDSRWGRSSFKSHPAAGSGWGRRQDSSSSAVAGGGAARPPSQPNFMVVLIAALLLLPGVTQEIADSFTQEYVYRNRVVTPHTQDDIDRAIAAFNELHPQKAPAPPEGYTAEYVSHCFHEKYALPENLRETFDEVVQSYITKNPKTFSMKLTTAVDRALLKIHESISEENGGQIPEKANRDHKEISDVDKTDTKLEPCHHSPSDSLLFNKLMSYRNFLNISHKHAIDFVNHYMSTVSVLIADSPTHNDIASAYQAMCHAFFPNSLYTSIREHGICSRTVLKSTIDYIKFQKLLYDVIYLAPPNIDDARIKMLQRSLCSPDRGVLLGILELKTDGSVTIWKQKRDKTFEQLHPLSILFICIVGYGGPKVFDNCYSHRERLIVNDHRSNALFVPKDERCFKQKPESGYAGEEFKTLCDKIMIGAGATPVSFDTSSVTEVFASSSDVAAAEEEPEILMCHHLQTVKKCNEYTECKRCTSEKPGRNPIKNLWGKVIGYQSR